MAKNKIKFFINKIKNNHINKFFILFIFIIFSIFEIVVLKEKENNENKIINEPFIPLDNKEYIIKNYNKSKFSLNHPRYYFQSEDDNKKIFKINYSYYPYLQINNNLSYEENVMIIYNSTGILNITKFEYFYTKKGGLNNLFLNHIHLSMAFDKNYMDLSLISIASILNTSSSDTYIHLHILGLNFGFKEIKKIINLRNINDKVEFIFYNAKQVEYDFYQDKKERRGYGVFAKILSPQIINNTNKILILDSGDILCQKDLSEIYFYDIKNNYFGWILENCAGNYLKWKNKDNFMSNNYYINTGVFLVNIPLFRKDELYKKAVFVSKSYDSFLCPDQDILITISNYKFAYFPLNYNLRLYYDYSKDQFKRKKLAKIKEWLESQKYSPYKYEVDEIIDAMSDPVIIHFYGIKLYYLNNCNQYVKQWVKYANITGTIHNLKKKYPRPFKCKIS
jgi:lipopolysaccharide biosynthesis glycosyltransferase